MLSRHSLTSLSSLYSSTSLKRFTGLTHTLCLRYPSIQTHSYSVSLKQPFSRALSSNIPIKPSQPLHSLQTLHVYDSQAKETNPYTILFLPSLLETNRAFYDPTILHFAKLGYDVGFLQLQLQPESKRSKIIEQYCEQIHKAVSHLGPQTIIMSSSLSSFVVQKYLESYSAAALVMVNPFPPDAKALINSAFNRQCQQSGAMLVNTEEEITMARLRKEFGYVGRFQSLFSSSVPKFLFSPKDLFGNEKGEKKRAETQKLLKDLDLPEIDLMYEVYTNPVKLEKSVVPMLFVYSKEDKILSAKDKESTLCFHGIQEDCCEIFETGNFYMLNEVNYIEATSHLFLLHQEQYVKQTNDLVAEWIGNL